MINLQLLLSYIHTRFFTYKLVLEKYVYTTVLQVKTSQRTHQYHMNDH